MSSSLPFPSQHRRSASQPLPDSAPRFSSLFSTALGSPFLTTADLHDPPADLDLVDGAFAAVPHTYTVTRPASPTPTADFSFISAPTDADVFATRRPFYGSNQSWGSAGGSPDRSSLRYILPRIWDALASPGKGSSLGRLSKSGSSSSLSYSPNRKGKGRADVSINYEDLPPLDGEEGELIDDEACFIDVRAITGIDIIALLPPEVSLHILCTFLDLSAILACLAVSRTWRALAADNAVWRALFLQMRDAGWRVNLDHATMRRDSKLYRAHLHTFPRMKELPPLPDSAGDAALTNSAPAKLIALDWARLYRERHELDRRWEQPCEPAVTRIAGHSDSVYCLEFDAERIVTGSRDRTIKVWGLRSGKLLGTFSGHRGSVLCLKFDWARGFMVSGSSDCSVFVWALGLGEAGPDGERAVHAGVRAVLRGHGGGVLDLRIDDQWIVSCSKDAVIQVWDRVTLALHQTLRGHEGPVNAVGLQSGRVVSASGDGKMMLWDIASGERLRTFEGHERGLACIEFKEDVIVSGSNDCRIKVWSASTGECLRTLVGHDALVRALSFDPRSGRLVSASYDKSVKVWDLASGRLIREFRNGHTSHIFDVKFDAARIVSTSHDQKIVVLDFGHGLDVSLFV